jgi:exosome complex RNA-binding protein Rrp4
MSGNDVRVVSIKHVPAVGNDLQLLNVTRVTIMVGSNGPFSRDFEGAEDTPEFINAWKQQKQNEIRSIIGS